jgi:hypothetical protein
VFCCARLCEISPSHPQFKPLFQIRPLSISNPATRGQTRPVPLYDIPVHDRGKPWHFKHLTIKHIYFPLAKSRGKVLELLRALKAKEGDRQKKLFQFLNELGARALRMHIGRVLEMAESSNDRWAYERRIVERFGGQQELDLVMPPAPAAIATDAAGAAT